MELTESLASILAPLYADIRATFTARSQPSARQNRLPLQPEQSKA
jgi:hypothetical protein